MSQVVVVDKDDHVTSAQVPEVQCSDTATSRRNVVRTFAIVFQEIHRKISFKSDIVNEIAYFKGNLVTNPI